VAPRARVLIAEDNDTLRRGLAGALAAHAHRVDEARSGDEAIERIESPHAQPYDVVLTDLRLPGADGLAVLRAVRKSGARTRVVVMTAYATIDGAVQAMREGAVDFVQKPFSLVEIEARVLRFAAEVEWPAARDGAPSPAPAPAGDLIGESPAWRAAVELARRVAPTRSNVLVTGETGTGKELLASLVHRASPRASAPFVKVNCAALPETLLESELFGHERGAFTGADRERIGRFEQASGGTLFLDEVGDTAPTTQAKLLRVLQDQEFHRLGGTRILRTDARIVAATNRDLAALVRAGSFREDLLFRLDVIRIHVPPLRERREDIPALAEHFLARFAHESQRSVEGFSAAAQAKLGEASWPGNVRELEHAIERAVLLAPGPCIELSDLLLPETSTVPGGSAAWPALGMPLADAERGLLLAALSRCGFVQKRAAEALGISCRKLNYMIAKHAIQHPSWRRNRGPSPSGERGGVEPARRGPSQDP
jgi:two-component system response regulator HydG